MSQVITEATTVLEATPVEGKPDRLLIGIISPGFGSSGYYSPDVLEAAATDKVFPAGTHMYFDHPTESDKFERPERSVLTLGAVLDEDARWDADLQKLVGEATPFEGPYKGLLGDKTFQKAIGVSIRASAEVSEGVIDGRRTTVIDRLVEGQSVDFVTRAGRGGSILNVYESARPSAVNEKAIGHGVAEATVNDKREALSSLVRDAYGAEKIWVWLRDFDDTTAYFDIESGDDAGTWSQPYSMGADDMPDALTGERTEVRTSTTYVPVHPAGQTNTQESKEDTMAETQIEESALADLREKAGRVPQLETELTEAQKERDEVKAENAELRESALAGRVSEIIAEADAEFNSLEAAGLKAQAPIKEGVLDEEAFKKTVNEAAAKLAEENGAGRPRGNGTRVTTTDDEVSEADLDALDDATFGAVKEG